MVCFSVKLQLSPSSVDYIDRLKINQANQVVFVSSLQVEIGVKTSGSRKHVDFDTYQQ